MTLYIKEKYMKYRWDADLFEAWRLKVDQLFAAIRSSIF